MELQKTQDGNVVRFSGELAEKKLVVEIGKMANQAHGSCTVQLGDTMVLATTVMAKKPREGVDYFPLMVDYEERLYAAGKIKGSRWIKREGRPSDDAILTGRLIDRSIRPLFADNIKNDVQVILTVLSVDGENDSDMVSLFAASAALAISPIPWQGPIGGIRVGQVDGKWTANPTFEQREKSDVDIILAGTKDKIIMVEANAQEASEEDMYAATEFSMEYLGAITDMISQIAKEAGAEKMIIEPVAASEDSEETSTPESLQELSGLVDQWLESHAKAEIYNADLPTKNSRKEIVNQLKNQLAEHLEEKGIGKDRRKKADAMYKDKIQRLVSNMILSDEKRVDGRKMTEIRALLADVGMLPRTHGSGLFSRGETQVLSVLTLGSPGDEQLLEGLEGNDTKRYMHHYNFPPFSVGETGRMMSPGRRSIGHGALAERALEPVLPTKEDFPYTIRVVSEVLSSNGSSSMGSVCGSSLALMDGGVPIKNPVAGIAMGIATDDKGNYKILTDLQDLEDGPGGMDFKIAGTADGITVMQMDTKTKGLTLPIVKDTLTQGKAARLEILKVMQDKLNAARPELSEFAPRITTLSINPEKIRDVIGSGGKVINEIIAETDTQIDIEPDGTILVTATDAGMSEKAVDWIKRLTKEVEVGETIEGKVVRILDFGAFVELTPSKDGMVHISELAHNHVNKVEDVVKLGDVVKVKVIAIDDQGRINLSMKALLSNDNPGGSSPRPRHQANKNRPRS